MKRSGALRLLALAAVLVAAFEAIEPWTDAEEANTCPTLACSTGDGSAGGSGHYAMLQKKVSGPARFSEPSLDKADAFVAASKPTLHHVDAFVDMAESAVTGARASLNNEGYSKVIGLQSRSELGAFLRRALKEHHLKVTSDEQLRDYAAWLIMDGEQQDNLHQYSALLLDLKELAERPCTWVIDPNKVAPHDGKSAPLDEDGYRMIAGLRSNKEMRMFISRLIKDQGLYVVDPGGLDGIVPYHDCEKEIQSLDRVLNEMRGVAATPDAWVTSNAASGKSEWSSTSGWLPLPPKKTVGADGRGKGKDIISTLSKPAASIISTDRQVSKGREAPSGEPDGVGTSMQLTGEPNGIGTSVEITDGGYYEVANAKSNIEMTVFILRVVKEMGMHVIHEDKFVGMVPYYSGELGFQTLDALKDELKKVSKELCAWVASVTESDAMDTSGKTVKMTEGGYKAVADMHSPMDMRDFLYRVLKDMHMQVLNKGGLMGFLPYHDCEHGAKTLKAMRSEINEAAQQKGWVRPMEQHEIKALEQEEVSANENEDKERKGHESSREESQFKERQEAKSSESEAEEDKSDDRPLKNTDEHPSTKSQDADRQASHAVDYVKSGDAATPRDREEASSDGADQLDLLDHEPEIIATKTGDGSSSAATPKEHEHTSSARKSDRAVDQAKAKKEQHTVLREGSKGSASYEGDSASPESLEDASATEVDDHPLDLLKVKKQQNASLDGHKGRDTAARVHPGEVSPKAVGDGAVDLAKVKKLDVAGSVAGHKGDSSNDEERASKHVDNHPIDLLKAKVSKLKVKKLQKGSPPNKHKVDDATSGDIAMSEDHKGCSGGQCTTDSPSSKDPNPPKVDKVQLKLAEDHKGCSGVRCTTDSPSSKDPDLPKVNKVHFPQLREESAKAIKEGDSTSKNKIPAAKVGERKKSVGFINNGGTKVGERKKSAGVIKNKGTKVGARKKSVGVIKKATVEEKSQLAGWLQSQEEASSFLSEEASQMPVGSSQRNQIPDGLSKEASQMYSSWVKEVETSQPVIAPRKGDVASLLAPHVARKKREGEHHRVKRKKAR